MSNDNIPKDLNEVIEKSKNLSESDAYSYANEVNKKNNGFQATVKEGKVEVKQILRG